MSLARYLSKLGALLTSDGKVPQAAMAANVAGNGPAFSAYQSTAQSALAAASFVKVLFQTEEYDTNSRFNNTGSAVNGIPAYAFMPNVAGYYQVNALVTHASAFETFIAIYKNGGQHKFGIDAGGSWASNASALVYLNGTTDYIEIYAYFGTSSSPIANSLSTYFQASLLRAA